ncbi:MAG: hypothetical protein R2750_13605 [Bacteroidales bacterium]
MMKRFAYVIMLIVIANIGYGQSSQLQSAIVYHRQGRLDKAKEAIDKATAHEKTINDAKTWYYSGKIYIDIYNSPDSSIRALAPDAINKSYESYQKARELDEKNQYSNDIAQDLPIVGEAFFNQGANLFNQGMQAQDIQDSTAAKNKFHGSMDSFEKAYKIYLVSGINDTTTIYYVSVAAELAEEYDIAKEKIQMLIDMDYQRASIYSSLASIYYLQDKDVEKALATYEMGQEKFPDDLNLLLMETNVFLAEEMTEAALANLQKAAEIDTTNATIFFAIGAKYNEIVDDTTRTEEMRQDAFEKAVAAYNKSLDIDPEFFDPAYNMGALYVNKASSVIEIANQLPLDEVEEYDRLKAEADKYLEDSLPYLEKAHQLQPDDVSTMASLKEIYTRLNMLEKLKEINAKLEGL